MSTVQYYQWAPAQNANVFTPAAYQARGELLTGVTAGVGSSTLANSAWRQGTMGTAVLANFIAQTTNADMLDDGNVQGFVTKFKSALATILVTSVPPLYAGQDTSTTVNTVTANVTPALTGPTNGGLYVVRNNNTNTGPVQMALNGGTSYPCVKAGNAPLAGLECKKGDWDVWTFNGSSYELIKDQAVSQSTTLYPTTVQQLQQTIVALSTTQIASNAFVNIQLPAGTFPLTSITGPLAFAHACGLQINLIGAPLTGSFPTATQIGTGTNAATLSLLQGVFPTVITSVGVNALEVRGYLGSVQNILFVGDNTSSGGHYGALVGNWSTAQPTTAATRFVNCWFHNFGLDNVRAEQSGVIQANNVGSTYAASHCFHISHASTLECNVGNVLAMYGVQGVAIQNVGLFAVDSASGTVDISNNSVAGIAGLGDATVNLNPATGVRIQNNRQYGIGSGFLCNIALSQNGSTQFSGNGLDINVNAVSNIITFGCSLPSGSSPGRGSSGNNGAYVY